MRISFLLLAMATPALMQTCSRDTGATCHLSACHAERNATCVDKKCMCPDGHCAVDGPPGVGKVCSFAPQCAAHTKCSSLQGSCCPQADGTNLDCCAPETIADKGNESMCGKDTGANCHVLGCKRARNATCESGQCICPDGYCTVPDPLYPEPASDTLCSYKAACAVHAGCQGLLGDCCPSPNGTKLDCCAPDIYQIRAGSTGLDVGLWALLGAWLVSR